MRKCKFIFQSFSILYIGIMFILFYLLIFTLLFLVEAREESGCENVNLFPSLFPFFTLASCLQYSILFIYFYFIFLCKRG
jgi:hypothetical protein